MNTEPAHVRRESHSINKRDAAETSYPAPRPDDTGLLPYTLIKGQYQQIKLETVRTVDADGSAFVLLIWLEKGPDYARAAPSFRY